MRYNPATDNAVYNERVQADMGWARLPTAAPVNPEPSEVDKVISGITYNLWGTSSALARLTRSEVGERSLYSIIQDLEEVVTELRKLCARA